LFLNEIVLIHKIITPDEILNLQREKIIKALNPLGVENSKDGMDCVLCAFDMVNMKLFFAGAYNQPYIIRNGELLEFKGDKMSVGKHERENEPFNLHKIDLFKGDIIYTFTDGYPDQFGQSDKKLKTKTLKEMLIRISNLEMSAQKEYLDVFIEEWKGGMEQTDDILIIGVKI
jgi:serine phosphatase RsbU (regulator of sigma subunit)